MRLTFNICQVILCVSDGLNASVAEKKTTKKQMSLSVNNFLNLCVFCPQRSPACLIKCVCVRVCKTALCL